MNSPQAAVLKYPTKRNPPDGGISVLRRNVDYKKHKAFLKNSILFNKEVFNGIIHHDVYKFMRNYAKYNAHFMHSMLKHKRPGD